MKLATLPDGCTQHLEATVSYLARLSAGSRPTQISALKNMAARLSNGGCDSAAFPWHRLDRARAGALRAWLIERYSPATVNRHLAALRGVLKECWRSGLMSDSDYHRTADLPVVKSQTLPAGRFLGPDDLQKLWAALGATKQPKRSRAILALLTGAGLRRSEVSSLEYKDVNFGTGELSIRGAKGGKDRVTWLGPQALAVLCDYATPGGKGRLFKVNSGGIYKQIIAAGKSAGLKHVTPHDLRRTFVTTLLERGADLSVVKELAGHADIQTTARYDRRGEPAKRAAAALLEMPS